ncbi:MAG: 3-oxoadipate enol-lactonase [Pseudomonadota bacterium]
MQMITRDGVALHYRDEGPKDGLTLVFANSLGTDFRVWDPLLPHLPEGLRILRYDKRGHGLSDAPPAPYQMDDHIGDVAAIIDHVGARDVVFVGLSIGGLIAQGLWAARPDLFQAIALVDTGHKIGTEEIWNERISTVEAAGIAPLADAVMERWFSAEFRANEPQLALWRNMLVRTTADGYAGSSAAIRDVDFTAVATSIAVPTLCVVGTEDGSTPPALVKELSELAPGARYAEIDGVGHIPCVEAPERLGALLTGFMSEIGLI